MKLINSGKDNIRAGIKSIQLEHPDLVDMFENSYGDSAASEFYWGVDDIIFVIWDDVTDYLELELTGAGWTQ